MPTFFRPSTLPLTEVFIETGTHQGTSALAQLKSRVGNSRRISDAGWHKEVCHAKVVRRSTDEARTG